MFDPSVDSRQKDAGGSELEHNRRSFGDQLPWTLFLQQVYRSGLSLARRQFSHLGYIVGHGANSEVYRYLINSPEDRMATTNLSSGQMLDRGTVVALKRIRPMRDNEESGVLRAAQKEIQVMAAPQLRNHEYIVKLHSVLWEDRDGKGAFWPTLVTEFCDCNLLELLNTQKLKMRTKLELYLGIGHGLGAIHAAGFVHGDIKCENVLIQHRGDEVIIPKLSDFGSSVYNNILADAVVVLAGTDPWRAPEAIALSSEIINL
jgi:serine/threonine protein kinase